MQDKDLEFLKECTNEELEFLVHLLIDVGGKTCSLDKTANFKLYHPDHIKYVDEIIDEIQRYASNSIKTLFVGHGEPYIKALQQTLKVLSVGFDYELELPELERLLLALGLKRYLDKIQDAGKRARVKAIFEDCCMNGALPLGMWDTGRSKLGELAQVYFDYTIGWSSSAARVVTPAVLYIASLRKKHEEAKQASEGF